MEEKIELETEIIENPPKKKRKVGFYDGKTPEEIKSFREKSAATRRRNTAEKRKFENTMRRILSLQVRGRDIGGIIRNMSVEEKMMIGLASRAMDTSDKLQISAIREIRDIVGDVSKAQVEVNTQNIQVVVPEEIKGYCN